MDDNKTSEKDYEKEKKCEADQRLHGTSSLEYDQEKELTGLR